MQFSTTQWLLIVAGVAIAAWIMSRNKALAGLKLSGPASAAVPQGLTGGVNATDGSIWGSLKI
jgi:hypothetical protein